MAGRGSAFITALRAVSLPLGLPPTAGMRGLESRWGRYNRIKRSRYGRTKNVTPPTTITKSSVYVPKLTELKNILFSTCLQDVLVFLGEHIAATGVAGGQAEWRAASLAAC